MAFYEILLRGDKDGKLKGAHIIRTDGGVAEPIKPEDWPSVCASINAASLKTQADVDALQAAFDLYVKSAQSAITATATAIADAKLDDKATVEAISAIVVELQTPEVEKQKAALAAQIASAQAELEALG